MGFPADNQAAGPRRGDPRTRLNDDEQGAVALFCLASLLVLLAFGLVLYDTGRATHDKSNLQSATDAAAMSQSAVKARAMNMIAYTNISKRSIWSIHSLYPGHMYAFRGFIEDTLTEFCKFEDGRWQEDEEQADDDDVRDIGSLCRIGIDNKNIYERETDPGDSGDFHTFTGEAYHTDFETGEPLLLDDFEAGDDGLGDYYRNELKALDNYQRHLAASAPWWAWNKQLMTGMRNGATLTASFPPPLPGGNDGIDVSGSDFDIQGVVGRETNDYAGAYDRLPISAAEDGETRMRDHIIDTVSAADFTISNADDVIDILDFDLDSLADPFLLEHLFNNIRLVTRSDGIYQCASSPVPPCASLSNYNSLSTFMDKLMTAWQHGFVGSDFLKGLDYSAGAFGGTDPIAQAAQPWSLDAQNTKGEWLTITSNLVLGYMDDRSDRRGDDGRDNYTFMGGDDPMEEGTFHAGDPISEGMYSAVGYWSMARSELTFTERDIGEPDMWHPAWTARMRPVVLPDEFQDQQFYMRQVFHTSLDSIRLAYLMMNLDAGGTLNYDDFEWDLARMEWMMNAMSQSTIEGVSR